MTVYGTLLPGARSIAQGAWRTERLTEEAKRKLKILDWHRKHGGSASLTARHFGIHRETVGTWDKNLRTGRPLALNEKSRRPKKTRVPTTHPSVVLRACQFRRQYPAWSKYEAGTLLRKEGHRVSDSTVGRIWKRRGLVDKKKSQRRRKAALKPKLRFPKGMVIREPGQLLQMDTKAICLPGGRKYWQFTAVDVLSKYRILRVYPPSLPGMEHCF